MINKCQVSVIFPVYNERDSIEIVLVEWKNALDAMHITHKLIVCEDGSKDGTKELLKKITPKYDLLLNSKESRRGYGGAVIDGILAADSNFILCVDSDGQCDAKDFGKFWEKRNMADVLIGWRVKRADAAQRKLFSLLFKGVHKILFRAKIHDSSCPFVLFKKDTVLPFLNYLTFLREGFWWGFVGMCMKKTLSLYEIPVNHRQRLVGDTQVYKLNKVPLIALRNLTGLIKLKLAK